MTKVALCNVNTCCSPWRCPALRNVSSGTTRWHCQTPWICSSPWSRWPPAWTRLFALKVVASCRPAHVGTNNDRLLPALYHQQPSVQDPGYPRDPARAGTSSRPRASMAAHAASRVVVAAAASCSRSPHRAASPLARRRRGASPNYIIHNRGNGTNYPN